MERDGVETRGRDSGVIELKAKLTDHGWRLADVEPPAVVEPPPALPSTPSREQIVRLERLMAEYGQQVEVETIHHHSDGLYGREIRIKAGTLLTGKVHRGEHLNIVSKGRITVWTEDGMKTVEAPFTLVSKPGTKRVGFAHTDTVWTTIHPNPENERDLDKLEAAYIIPESEYLECLG